MQTLTRSRTVLNETPALAPDGQPYRLLTLRNDVVRNVKPDIQIGRAHV